MLEGLYHTVYDCVYPRSCRMTSKIYIAPTDVRDYAKAKGWVLLKEAAKDRLYVMTHPAFEHHQLVFPMDATAPDYLEAVTLVTGKLAAIEGRTPQSVLKSLLEVGDDAIGFKVEPPRRAEQSPSLSLAFVGSMLEGVQQLLLSSVCTILRPRIHHPSLDLPEAQQLIEAARFRHTQMGSFVLNVSCPVQSMDVQTLLADQVPFVRRSTLVLHRSLVQLIDAIESNTLDALVETQIKSCAPLISSNFCEALARFEDLSLKNSIEIGITWAAIIAVPPGASSVSTVRVQNDYFSRIEEVRRELSAAAERQPRASI